MRIRTYAVLAAAAMFTTACATKTSTSTTVSGTPVLTQVPAPVAAPAFNPAGKWLVTLVAQGQQMSLTMDLVKNSDGTWGGSFTSDMFPPMTITKADLTGNKMVITIPVPTGDMATINITFDGDIFEGEWSMPGDGSKTSGRRL